MKKTLLYLPIFCLLCLMAVACADENDFNTTADAVVGMEQATYTVKENKGIFLVPITVSGERNGAVEVDVDVVSNDPNCIENKHYIVTSRHLIIPLGKNRVNVEIKTVDDRVINPDRTFGIRIVSAQGAQVSSTLAQTTVTLMDNDDIPYDRMGGKWMITATDELGENGPAQVSWQAQLVTATDEEEDGYGTTIMMSPWRMWNGETYEDVLEIKHSLSFHYNASSQKATLSLKLGEVMASEIILGGENEDGRDLTNCTMRSATPTAVSYTTNGTLTGTVNEDFTQITFNLPLMGLLYDANNLPFSYWFWYSNIVMNKIAE